MDAFLCELRLKLRKAFAGVAFDQNAAVDTNQSEVTIEPVHLFLSLPHRASALEFDVADAQCFGFLLGGEVGAELAQRAQNNGARLLISLAQRLKVLNHLDLFGGVSHWLVSPVSMERHYASTEVLSTAFL